MSTEHVKGNRSKSSGFDLSHDFKFSTQMGQLTPILAQDVIPGDRFNVQTNAVIRFSPLLAPVMHKVNITTHYFFVPNRLIWDNWEPFITGGDHGTDATIPPTIDAPSISGFPISSLADYLGIPPAISNLKVSALPFRAYGLIFNEWYRAQDLQDDLVVSTADGTDTTTNTTMVNRNWQKDYFTACLPYAQKGPAVQLPLGTTAPVVTSNEQVQLKVSELGSDLALSGQASGSLAKLHGDTSGGAVGMLFGSETGLETDLSSATAATVNDIRLAFQVQKFMERNARSGSRYVESILSHFGIRSSDARLQRPEYLGGGKSNVVFSEVLQTSSTDETTPQANMAGHGFSAQQSHQFSKRFEEHGWIIGLISIMPKTAYQQGLPRKYSRETKYDYLWPEFVNLGEQGVLNKEIYADGTSTDEEVFGYQARYEEYRREFSHVAGDFREDLDQYHMGRKFDTLPLLNSSFVTSDPTDRIFAVTEESEDKIWCHLEHNIKAVRQLPKFGTPGLIDHN